MSLLKDKETGVRGCMFLQDTIYLQPFYQAKTFWCLKRITSKKFKMTEPNYADQAKVVLWMVFIFGFGVLLFACWRLLEEFQKQIEYARRLEDPVKHLAYNNEELEASSFTFAHYFQEPLRKTVTFADRLKRAHGSEFSEEARGTIGKIGLLSKELGQYLDRFYHKIEVQDDGMGFELEHKNQISDIFEQINPTKLSDGNGVGLTICRQIVWNHGWLIHVNSKLG